MPDQTADTAGEHHASRVRAVIDQYAAEAPGDGDYGDVTRDQITPEAMDALRAVVGLSDEVDRRIVAALRKADRPEGEARQTPAGEDVVGDRVALLRLAAEGRREYAAGISEDEQNPVRREDRATMLTQAATLESAARIVEGDDGPLYGLLPSWRWTDEMDRKLHARPAFGAGVKVTLPPKAPQTSACCMGCGTVHRPDCDASETYNRPAPAEEPGETW